MLRKPILKKIFAGGLRQDRVLSGVMSALTFLTWLFCSPVCNGDSSLL